MNEFYFIQKTREKVGENELDKITILDLTNKYFFDIYGKDLSDFDNFSLFEILPSDLFVVRVKNGYLKYYLNR